MKKPPRTENPMEDLLTLAYDLRDKDGGCPWDIEQTHESLAKYLIEESSELVDVIEEGIIPSTVQDFKEELGDVLFQVVIHAQLAKEKGYFTFHDVARTTTEKLVSRHPHVYGESVAQTPEEVLRAWEKIKLAERENKKNTRIGLEYKEPSYIDGVAKAMPALQRAQRLGEKASRSGFDWPSGKVGVAAVREKINEELEELDRALLENHARAKEELGDLLFTLTQYGRLLGIDTEGALRSASKKFEKRFRFMEKEVLERIKAGEKISASEWESLWRKAKTTLRS
ncbi:MAG: Nucleoside triphosphate pyrophosphohydrolase [Turneriella sp.]|nr:Nucleoside triphosphate pyrophosphohydrolase [Turneriella sp.]